MNKYIIGVDVGGTNVKLGVVDPKGRIVARSRLDTKAFNRDKYRLIHAITNGIEDLLIHEKLSRKNVLGVGMGMPGFINPLQGKVLFLPNIPGWRHVPLARIAGRKLGLPVFIDNDVNLIALAESKIGAGRGCPDLVCITLGTGVGGGLILDNKLYRGHSFLAGEIGHIRYLDKTLELYVGNRIIQEKAARVFRNAGIQNPDIRSMAARGDSKAIKFWFEIGEHIGFIMAGVVNVLNPALIVVGGGVSNNFRFIAPGIRAGIRKNAIAPAAKSVRVVRARLGDDAGIIGAGYLVRDLLLER